jgi:hypothetical protein
MKRFSDFAEPATPMDGTKKKLDDILNRDLIICDCKISESKYAKDGCKEYAIIQFKENGNDELFVVFTGSKVLINQCESNKDMMPFLATIKKINKYYTFN